MRRKNGERKLENNNEVAHIEVLADLYPRASSIRRLSCSHKQSPPMAILAAEVPMTREHLNVMPFDPDHRDAFDLLPWLLRHDAARAA
ncbi:MAG: hypothetical protein VX475_01100, partial [Myxococcota bacterium]|nr:hypothetical protein [Myxococcota bacterium]